MVSWQSFWKKNILRLFTGITIGWNIRSGWGSVKGGRNQVSASIHGCSNPPPSHLLPWSQIVAHAFCLGTNSLLSSADKRAECAANAQAAV